MSALSFYIAVIRALEEIEAPYMIVGAFAGLAFGVTRVTLANDGIATVWDLGGGALW